MSGLQWHDMSGVSHGLVVGPAGRFRLIAHPTRVHPKAAVNDAVAARTAGTRSATHSTPIHCIDDCKCAVGWDLGGRGESAVSCYVEDCREMNLCDLLHEIVIHSV